MIKKTEKLIITFYTTTDAMAMERICKEKQTDGRIIPVPGSISADCGLAWYAKLESEEAMSASRIVYDARLALAEFFGSNSPERIAFTANAT